MNYVGKKIRKEFDIDKIFSIHYFEYVNDFSYHGESHDFWEFVYIDKGAIEVIEGTKKYNLVKGDIIFHKPNIFHSLRSYGRMAPNLVVMSFSCVSPGIQWFSSKVLRIGNEEKNLLARIIHEAGNAFSSSLSDPWLLELKRKNRQTFASEQLIKLYLEQFLIGMVRRIEHINIGNEPASPLKEKTSKDAFDRVIEYCEKNLLEMKNLHTICRETGYSCTYIENVFKEKTGTSVIEYYKKIKIEKAKDLIREGNYTFTQIASILNYSSVHYFSKIFKRCLGMTPTEYSSSVKLKL